MGGSTMNSTNKLWIVLILVFLPMFCFGLLEMNKPVMRVDVGEFTAAQVFGPQVARAKNMSGDTFSRRIQLRNFDFSAAKYKEKYLHDIAMASDWSATILTDNEVNAYDALELINLRWFKIEIYDWKGRLVYDHNDKLHAILWDNVQKIWSGISNKSQQYLDQRRKQIAWAIKELEPQRR